MKTKKCSKATQITSANECYMDNFKDLELLPLLFEVNELLFEALHKLYELRGLAPASGLVKNYLSFLKYLCKLKEVK